VLATSPIAAAPAYHRHRPELTALYAIVAEHYPSFLQEIECSGGHLPRFIRQEFDDYLKCGLLEHGFLRVKCDGCRFGRRPCGLSELGWPYVAPLLRPKSS
jgi:hypothetical protein